MKYRRSPLEVFHEAYYMSGPVAEQGMRALCSLLQARGQRLPEVVVEIGAGSGTIAQRGRLVLPEASFIGVEIRGAAEESHAARHYDEWIVGDFRDVRVPSADLYVFNAPYSQQQETVQFSLGRTRPGGHVLSFARATWGTSQEGAAFLRRHVPAENWIIPGRCDLLGGGTDDASADFVGHCWWLWDVPATAGPALWGTRLLELLPEQMRRWSAVRPGDELQVDPLPQHLWPRLEVRRAA